MTTEFRQQLIAARDESHSKNHPFIDKWASGKLSKAQTAVYVVQHYHFVTDFLDWMAYLASQIPMRDVKRHLLTNLAEEEDPEDRHIDMLLDYAGACGVSRDAMLKSKVLPWTQALRDWGWRVAYQAPWQVALAGFLIGLESQPPDIYRRIVPAFARHYGWPEGSREVRFFATHIGADMVHSQRGFEVVETYCDTEALRGEAIRLVRTASGKRWNHMNGIYWYALHGREDDTPPFP